MAGNECRGAAIRRNRTLLALACLGALMLSPADGSAGVSPQDRLTEKEAIELALRQHPAVKVSQDRVTAARA